MRGLSRLARAVARYAYLLLLSMVLVGGAAYVSSIRTPNLYQASALLAIEPGSYTTDSNLNLGAVPYVISLAQSYASAPLTPDVLAAAHLAVPDRSQAQIQAEVHLVAVPAQPQLTVLAQDSDAETAQDLANNVALALVSHYTVQATAAVQQNAKVVALQEQVRAISAQMAATRAAIASAQERNASTSPLYTQLLQEQVQSDQLTAQLTTAQQAALQAQPIFWLSSVARTATLVQADALVSTLLGVAAGLLVGVGLALLLDSLDITVRSVADTQRWIGPETLGIIPAAPATGGTASLAMMPEQYALVAGPFRRLFTNLRLLNVTRAQQTLLVTLADPELADDWALADVNGWVAMHLAVTSALAGQQTLLLDANWDIPTVETRFGLPLQETGLFTSMLGVESGAGPSQIAVRATEIPHLSVLAVGIVPPNHEDLLNSDLLDRLMHTLRKEYQQIVVLGPRPLLRPPGTRFAELADGTLLVVRSGATSGIRMARTVAALRKADVYLTGTVMLSDIPVQASASTWPVGSMTRQEQAPTIAIERARPAGPLRTWPDEVPVQDQGHGDEPSVRDGTSPHTSSV